MNHLARTDLARTRAARAAGAITAQDVRDLEQYLLDGVTNVAIGEFLASKGF